MKHTYDKKWLEHNILKILSLLNETNENLQNQLIVYIFERSGWKAEQIILFIETLPKTLKKTVMSTMDYFVEKGKKMGVEEGEKTGIEKGKRIGVENTLYKNTCNMISKGFPLETICEVLEVSAAYVSQVKSEMGKIK